MKNKTLLMCNVIYYLLIVAAIIYNDTLFTGYKAINVFAAIITPPIIFMFFKIIKVKISSHIIFLSYFFSAASIIFGNLFKFYQLFDSYDKILHLFSGVLVTVFAYFLYLLLTKNMKKGYENECIITLLFINALNITSAFLWELFEFGVLIFLEIDSIRHHSTGVYDAMGDMIICMIGGFIISVFIYSYYKTKKDNILTKAGDNFIKINL